MRENVIYIFIYAPHCYKLLLALQNCDFFASILESHGKEMEGENIISGHCYVTLLSWYKFCVLTDRKNASRPIPPKVENRFVDMNATLISS